MSIDFKPMPAEIENIDRTVEDNHLFRFRLDKAMPTEPGQFAELSLAGIGAFPVSSAAWDGDERTFHACIRRTGRVTDALYGFSEGDRVGIRGPFGNGFPLESFAGRNVLLMAGGLGMAPLRSLLHYLLHQRNRKGEITLLYGSREPSSLLFRHELEDLAKQKRIRLRFSVDFATELPWSEGGAVCKVGLVPELLEDVGDPEPHTVAAVCGPPVLYACVLEELAQLGIDPDAVFANLERRMKCGVGQCCHCVTGGTYLCTQGPVFSLSELRAMPGAI